MVYHRDIKKRKNLFLDLDATLIDAHATDEYDFEKNEEKATRFVFHDMDNYYIIFERPKLQSFLDYIFANFNVSVWTAASRDYALFIVDNIILSKPGRKLDWVFFNYHCNLANKYYGGTKNMRLLWEKFKLGEPYTEKTTWILDDYDEVYKTNKINCIPIKPFEFHAKDSSKDDILDSIKIKLEKLQDIQY